MKNKEKFYKLILKCGFCYKPKTPKRSKNYCECGHGYFVEPVEVATLEESSLINSVTGEIVPRRQNKKAKTIAGVEFWVPEIWVDTFPGDEKILRVKHFEHPRRKPEVFGIQTIRAKRPEEEDRIVNVTGDHEHKRDTKNILLEQLSQVIGDLNSKKKLAEWFERVGDAKPVEAIKLYLEVAKFYLPQAKEQAPTSLTQVNLNYSKFTDEQLHALLQGVTPEQLEINPSIDGQD